MDKAKRIKDLTDKLNTYRDAYYNNQTSIVSDYEYDSMFDELRSLESETGIIMGNSPTQTVGYEVKSKLEKVKHNHPMLSLDKTKSIQDLKSFVGDKQWVMMLKMDGLTVSLRYVDGKLVSAETRGNGEIGEDVLHTAKTFINIPRSIPVKGEVIVDGEAIIPIDTFERINAQLPKDQKYKNPRNLVSGSVRQLDAEVAAKRGIEFIAWKCVKGSSSNTFSDRLEFLGKLGFDVVPYGAWIDKTDMSNLIESLRSDAEKYKYPIDGMVVGYQDIAYGNSLGQTGHHLRSQMAYKFYDEEEVTILRDIEWTMGKTGDLTPVAVFDDVELEGTTVNRASLHNISICEQLQIGIGDEITVYKANQIIPQVRESLIKSGKINIPGRCPVCGGHVEIVKEKDSKVLRCVNPECRGKLLGKLIHAVSRNALNIEGLSEAKLERLYNHHMVRDIQDIYHLENFEREIAKMDGFGEKSTQTLLDNIEKSRKITLDRFIYALSIPMVGREASKVISNYFGGSYEKFITLCNGMDWAALPSFGPSIASELKRYFDENLEDIEELSKEFLFYVTESDSDDKLMNLTFVITGSLNLFPNREYIKKKIESLGGKVSGSVTSKTSYLINNDITSNSSKNKKAKELQIPIITEEDFVEMIGGNP